MRTVWNFRRFVAAAMALVMALSLTVPAFALDYTTHIDPGCPLCNSGGKTAKDAVADSISFSDVPSTHTFHDAIIWCAGEGIVGGYSDGTFKPANTVTRSNFTVMLSRAFYADEVAKYSTEKNLAYGAFYPNYLAMRLYGALSNTSFSTVEDIRTPSVMNKGIARYDMAQLMTNIMNSKGFAASSSDKNAAIAKIADYNEIPSQYKDAVLNVYALGIIGGYSNGTFGGEVSMNRGQAAIVIYRMMQFSGGSGGQITNPDPETPVDPSTGEVVCACVTATGHLCEICHSTTPGATTPVTPVTPVVPDPVEPETPAAKTLRDGSAVTEANARKIINEILQVYPNGATWDDNTRRNSSTLIGGRELGSPSKAVVAISDTYFTSIHAGCGGFAGLVSDAIFGGSTTGGENFPARKLDSLSQIRPGDILVKCDGTTGRTMHVVTAASTVKETRTSSSGVTVYTITIYDGNNGDKVSYKDNGVFKTPFSSNANYYYEAWTRYPA